MLLQVFLNFLLQIFVNGSVTFLYQIFRGNCFENIFNNIYQRFQTYKMLVKQSNPMFLNLFLPAAHFGTFSKFAAHLDQISCFSSPKSGVL